VINALIYPALLISVGGLVSLFLLLYVVPRFGTSTRTAAPTCRSSRACC